MIRGRVEPELPPDGLNGGMKAGRSVTVWLFFWNDVIAVHWRLFLLYGTTVRPISAPLVWSLPAFRTTAPNPELGATAGFKSRSLMFRW